MPPRILVVDDEPYIADLVTMGLRYQGFEIETVESGYAALAAAERQAPDLLILDVMLPDLDGFEVCRRIRAAGSDVPVVFLTAKDAIEDRVAGFGLGGDDYVTKPFSLEELVARVRAVLRRVTPDSGSGDHLQVADLVLDERSRTVTKAGAPVELTATEFKLLHFLMANAGRVVSKALILDHVWDHRFEGDENVVETYVSYLRRKLGRAQPLLIHTVRGVGYVVRPPA